MKLILCFMMTLLISCSTTKIPTNPVSLYDQRTAYILKTIIEDKKLSDKEKLAQVTYVKCYRDLLVNPATIDNLMDWQKVAIYNHIKNVCYMETLRKMEKAYGRK